MREVLTIHLGQAGVGMGTACWEAIAAEHNITEGTNDLHYGGDYLRMFTARDNGMRVEPRALFVDSDTQSIDDLKQTFTGSLMSEGQLIASKEDSAGVYARGEYCIGPTLVEEAMERVRRMAEECSALQGFYIQHSTAGGTGSALADLLLQHLAVEYPHSSRHTISVSPGTHRAVSVVSPYNELLSSHSLLEYSEVSILYDNQALTRLAASELDIPNPSYCNLNEIVAQAVSSLTESIRFDGALHHDISEIRSNLVPYPDLHFILQSLSPLQSAARPYHRTVSVYEITMEATDPRMCLASCDVLLGKLMGCCLCYRGYVIPKEVSSDMICQLRRKIGFVDWCPTGFKCGIGYYRLVKPQNCVSEASDRSISVLLHSTAVKSSFTSTLLRFRELYKKRAFLHWFTVEGMEETEFKEAEERITSLVSDYNECEADTEENPEDAAQ